MAEPKWTPGPWEAQRYGSVCRVKKMGSTWGGGGIAEVLSDHREADANLIAAAPDMYKVLVKWDRVLRRGVASLSDDEWDELAEETWASLRKARGEASE